MDAVSSCSEFDLRWLIAPTSLNEFWSSYWEREPLIVQRQDQGYYGALFSLADVDHVLSTSAIRRDDVRIVKRGDHTSLNELGPAVLPGSANRLEGLYREYRAGATVILQALHERWQSLRQLCGALGRAISGTAQVNVYLTPPGESGLPAHYDTHDVLVLQASGSKRWRIFGRAVDTPTRDQPYEQVQDPGEVTREFDLQAGDLLYLPRGFVHVAEAHEQTSLHLTVGLHPITVGSVVRAIVEGRIESDPGFRRALPPGFAHDALARARSVTQIRDALDTLARDCDADRAAEQAANWAKVSELPTLEGHLLDLEVASKLCPESKLQLRRDLAWTSNRIGKQLRVTFNGKQVSMPAFVEPCIEKIASGRPFVVCDLPDSIDDESKLVLSKRLLHEGFLRAV